MESKPPMPKRDKIDQEVVESSSSSTPNQEPEPLLIPNFFYLGELVFDFLLRLPAKSLLRFKCVSKSWLSLISSPRFIKAHVAIASERDDYAQQALILSVHTDEPEFGFGFQHELYSVSSLLYGPADETPTPGLFDVGLPRKYPSKSFVVVGSCDGLICIFNYDNKDLFLWNPCVKKSKKLPSTGMENKGRCNESFGFGYDKLNEDYKVVGVFWDFERHREVWKVYSLKNNSWSEIDDSKIRRLESVGRKRCFLYEKGKLHWLFGEGSSWKIGSLDLANETYEEMDCPDYEISPYCKKDGGHSELGVLGGYLCVLYHYKRTRVDVWVMKEYGVKDSWSKLFSIPCNGEGHMYGKFQPVCLSRNGEILFVLGSMLLLYNPKRDSYRRYPRIGFLENVVLYVESLVSPNAYDT